MTGLLNVLAVIGVIGGVLVLVVLSMPLVVWGFEHLFVRPIDSYFDWADRKLGNRKPRTLDEHADEAIVITREVNDG